MKLITDNLALILNISTTITICLAYFIRYKQVGLRETCLILLMAEIISLLLFKPLLHHEYAVTLWYFIWGLWILLQLFALLIKGLLQPSRTTIDPVIALLLLCLLTLQFARFMERNLFLGASFSNLYGIAIPCLNFAIVFCLYFPDRISKAYQLLFKKITG